MIHAQFSRMSSCCVPIRCDNSRVVSVSFCPNLRSTFGPSAQEETRKSECFRVSSMLCAWKRGSIDFPDCARGPVYDVSSRDGFALCVLTRIDYLVVLCGACDTGQKFFRKIIRVFGPGITREGRSRDASTTRYRKRKTTQARSFSISDFRSVVVCGSFL